MAHVSSLWSTTLPRGGALSTSTDSTALVFDAICLPTDLPRNLVYISGDELAGKIQVTTANISDHNKLPVRGMILSKTSLTACKVVMLGMVMGFTDLDFGRQYWCSTTGTLVLNPPDVAYAQYMGAAISTTKLFFNPGLIYTL